VDLTSWRSATAKAREMVEAMRRKGDEEGADTWLRIIVAIGTLGDPPTDAALTGISKRRRRGRSNRLVLRLLQFLEVVTVQAE
jgi:hypothetical protein